MQICLRAEDGGSRAAGHDRRLPEGYNTWTGSLKESFKNLNTQKSDPNLVLQGEFEHDVLVGYSFDTKNSFPEQSLLPEYISRT